MVSEVRYTHTANKANKLVRPHSRFFYDCQAPVWAFLCLIPPYPCDQTNKKKILALVPGH